jgi:hypothetical protein
MAHDTAEGRHDMAATLSTLHPECVFIDEPLGLRFEGRDGARRHYEMWWTGFGVKVRLRPQRAAAPARPRFVRGTARLTG